MSIQYTPSEWDAIQAEAEQTGESIPTFSTREEAIQQEIAPALQEWDGDYDLNAIFDDCFELAAIVDEDGVQHGNGWCQQSVSDTEFWASVEKHAL